MITRIVLFMAVLMGWGCTPLVIQAKTAPVSLSFDGMILRLGTENPFLRPMDLEATAEREKAFQEAAYPNPEVSGSWGSSRSDGSSVRTSQVSFQQELDYSFRWLSRRSVAGARVIARKPTPTPSVWSFTVARFRSFTHCNPSGLKRRSSTPKGAPPPLCWPGLSRTGPWVPPRPANGGAPRLSRVWRRSRRSMSPVE